MDVWGKIYKDHWAGRNSLKRMMTWDQPPQAVRIERLHGAIQERLPTLPTAADESYPLTLEDAPLLVARFSETCRFA